jgi:tetratricopeptide (TPR) repeat protein
MKRLRLAWTIPLDFLRATADFLLACGWLFVSALFFQASHRKPFKGPFRCGALFTGDAVPLCRRASQYHSKWVFRLLCPGAGSLVDQSWVSCRRMRAGFGVSWPRFLLLGAALALIWSVLVLTAVTAGTHLKARFSGPSDSERLRASQAQQQETPKSVTAEARARAGRFLASAKKFEAEKKYREASIEYKNALKDVPFSVEARFGLGECLFHLGEMPAALDAYESAIKEKPDMGEAHLQVGRTLLAMGGAAYAYTSAQTAARLLSQNPAAQVLLAATLQARNDLDGARAALVRARENPLATEETHRFAAALYALMSDLATAEKSYRRALELAPESLASKTGLAGVLRLLNHPEKSIEILEGVLAKEPDNAKARAEMAEAFLAQGKVAEALTEYEEIVEASPAFYSARARLADLYIRAGGTDEGFVQAEALLKDNPGNLAANLVLARLYLDKGLYSLAERHALEALKLNPENAGAGIVLAKSFLAMGRHQEAMARLEKILERLPRDFEARMLMGDAKARAGDFEAAKKHFGEAALAWPASPLPHFQAGQACVKAGDFSQALKDFEEAARRAPDDASVKNNVAYLLLALDKEPERALALAKDVQAKLPDNLEIADTVGFALLKNGKPAEAVKALQKVAEGMPGNPLVRYHFGAALLAAGDRPGAVRELKAALAVPGGFPGAGEAKALLQKAEAESNRT